MHQEQVHELLYQALETELGGMKVYQTALQCTVNAELKQEWHKYLEQTETHAQVLRELFATLKLNPDQDTPGRQVVRHLGHALVTAMEMALAAGNPEAAQLVAAECVVTALQPRRAMAQQGRCRKSRLGNPRRKMKVQPAAPRHRRTRARRGCGSRASPPRDGRPETRTTPCRPQGGPRGRYSRRLTSSTTITPTLIAESATLNAGQCRSPQCASRKSITSP